MAYCSDAKFYKTFVDNKVIQAKGILPAEQTIIESLVFQSEQYHPVAPTHLHKGLKCEHYKCQATKYCPSLIPRPSVPVSFPD